MAQLRRVLVDVSRRFGSPVRWGGWIANEPMAEADDAHAWTRLAELHAQGEDVPQDDAWALACYRRALHGLAIDTTYSTAASYASPR